MTENRWISDLHWKREGQQSRSEKTQTALLDAAESLFGQHGIEATSVNAIAKEAGVSVGALYHHFKDKRALTFALFDRMTRELEHNIQLASQADRWDGATVADIIRGYVGLILTLEQDRPGYKSTKLELVNLHPELQVHVREIEKMGKDNLFNLIMARQSEISHPAPKRAVRFTIEQLDSMVKTYLTGHKGSEALFLTPEDFTAELLRSTLGYLGVKIPQDL